MNLLQRSLLSPELMALAPNAYRNCFSEVLFPLLTALLKPFPSLGEDAHITAINVEETRVRATALLAKLFLQYACTSLYSLARSLSLTSWNDDDRFLPQLAVLPDFHGQLWLQILRYLEMYMSADHGGFLAEAIPEALKNMLLVMLASGVFGTSNAPVLVNGSDVWGLTWQMLDRFCPTLQADDSFLSSLRAFGTSLSRARARSPSLFCTSLTFKLTHLKPKADPQLRLLPFKRRPPHRPCRLPHHPHHRARTRHAPPPRARAHRPRRRHWSRS